MEHMVDKEHILHNMGYIDLYLGQHYKLIAH